ncbi:MerR family DNA-binding transcriptional regulator [Streptomyces sp. NPDC057445]|uniref:MerR family DNA-binding transcriptional regulator n=1 Tax=Streptomyces sp. NPDC057445 TaxID=3346136 RepID=UPI0036BF8A43
MTSGNAVAHTEPAPTVTQVAERTGLSPDTLRHDERAGLFERVGRSTGNQRRYAAADLARLEFLLLRETGMPVSDMQRSRSCGQPGRPPSPTGRPCRASTARCSRTVSAVCGAPPARRIGHYERLLAEQPEQGRGHP